MLLRLSSLLSPLLEKGYRFALCCPPSTLRHAPVTHCARFEQRKTATSAISSGVPNLPQGMVPKTVSYKVRLLSFTMAHTPPANSMEPGVSVLTRIRWGASDTARVLA